MNRTKEIIKTSLIGIACNVLLSVFKFAVGTLANSVSIVMDAVNNLSDSLSSVITLIGTKLSEKEPDRKHPFGYGRVEYITSLVIGIVILYAGFAAVRESILRIMNPQPNDYSHVTLAVVAVAVVVKVALGIYTKKRGKALDSTSLVASGQDALDDSIATAATLVAGILYNLKGISIEAYVGVLISLLIIKTGVETLKETVSNILGERVSLELASAVKKSIMSFPEVDGVFGLAIHNYGKEKLVGSAHVEVADVLKAGWIDNLQRAITKKVREDTGVEMRGITIYAVNARHTKATEVQSRIRGIVAESPDVIGMHGFYLDEVDKAIKFTIVVDFDTGNKASLRESIRSRAVELFPGYDVDIELEYDIS